MSCDYFIQTELIIQYYSKDKKIKTIRTNRLIKKCYLYYQKNEENDITYEIDKKIKDNTYQNILYKDENWINNLYKKKYKNYIFKSFNDIDKLIKVYENNTAFEEIF